MTGPIKPFCSFRSAAVYQPRKHSQASLGTQLGMLMSSIPHSLLSACVAMCWSTGQTLMMAGLLDNLEVSLSGLPPAEETDEADL